tara:strand:- start:1128 stop:2042 length:915 start_codon:yes stop_codon:yes gene_type:complete
VKTILSRILRRALRYIDPPPPPLKWRGLEDNWTKPVGKKLIIVTGVGRNGAHWVSKIFGEHENTIGLSDPCSFHTAFFRYCVWNDLPIDSVGTFVLLRAVLYEAWEEHDVVCIASPYLGIGINIVDRYLQPDAFILSLRSPEKVVSSMANKGWYNEPVVNGGLKPTTGLQPAFMPQHRQFSRLTPRGSELADWQDLTPVGKCSWYWSALNKRIYAELSELHQSRFHLYKLADVDQNPAFNKKLEELFDLTPINDQQFLNLKKTASNAGRKKSTDDGWTETEKSEFHKGISEFHETFQSLKTTVL